MPLFKFEKKSEHSSEPSSSQSSPSPRVIAWNGLLSTLPIVEQSLIAVPVPGVRAAVGGLLEILRGLEVREKSSSVTRLRLNLSAPIRKYALTPRRSRNSANMLIL